MEANEDWEERTMEAGEGLVEMKDGGRRGLEGEEQGKKTFTNFII